MGKLKKNINAIVEIMPLADSAPDPALSRWDNSILVPFATDGEKVDVPATSITEELNIATGFTKPYSQALDQGGKAVPREGINALYNRIDKSIQELQGKVSQVQKALTEDGFDYTLSHLPSGDVIVHVWGAADLPAGSGSQSDGNDITIKLPYTCISEHSGYSLMLRPPVSSTQQAVGWITGQTPTSVTFHTPLYSASEPIHYHINLTLVGDIGAYPGAPTGLTASNPLPVSVKLNWIAPTTGAPVISYNVYSSLLAESGYVFIANVTDTSWTDTRIPSDSTIRYYKVAALSVAGEGFFSNLTQGTFLLPPEAPDATLNPFNVTIRYPSKVPSFASIRLFQRRDGGEWIRISDNMVGDVNITPDAGIYYFCLQFYVSSVSSDYGAASASIDVRQPAPSHLTGNRLTKTLYWSKELSDLGFRILRNGSVLVNETTESSYHVANMGNNENFIVEAFSGGLSASSNSWNSYIPFVLAGSTNGIYKSVNGGINWTRV